MKKESKKHKVVFEWKQSSESNMPNIITMAVNRLPQDLLIAMGRVEAERAFLRWVAMGLTNENLPKEKKQRNLK